MPPAETPPDHGDLRKVAEPISQAIWIQYGVEVRLVTGELLARCPTHRAAEFIATFDPPTVLALLDEVATLRAERDAATKRQADLSDYITRVERDLSNAYNDRAVLRRERDAARTTLGETLANNATLRARVAAAERLAKYVTSGKPRTAADQLNALREFVFAFDATAPARKGEGVDHG